MLHVVRFSSQIPTAEDRILFRGLQEHVDVWCHALARATGHLIATLEFFRSPVEILENEAERLSHRVVAFEIALGLALSTPGYDHNSCLSF